MFDYEKWKDWLERKKSEFQTQEISASFRYGPDDGPKPGMAFGLVGPNAMGSLDVWFTGETDYTVLKPSNRDAEMVSNKWTAISKDETFEATFNEFVAEFMKHNLASNVGRGSRT